MKPDYRLSIILLFLLSALIFSQAKEIDSLKQSFSSIYKEIIDNNITDNELKEIVDSLFFISDKSEQNLLKRIENYINDSAEIEEKEYTVVQGDCLWTIAKKVTGNPYNWSRIYEINETLIKNPDLIFPNQKIKTVFVSKRITSDSTVSKLLAALLINEEEKIIPVEKKDTTVSESMEIENFIVDETLSKIGKDYFDLFYTKWESQITGAINYSIVISEKTLPQRGTQISIKVNDLDIYQSFIQPRFELIEQSVDEGIYMVFSYLQNYEAIQKELEKGDMKGSGIY